MCPSLTLYWLVEVVSSLLQHTTAHKWIGFTNCSWNKHISGLNWHLLKMDMNWNRQSKRSNRQSNFWWLCGVVMHSPPRQTYLVYLLNDGVENITNLMTTRARITNFGNKWKSFHQLYGYWQNTCYSKAQMTTAFLGQGSKSHVLHNHATAEEKA